MLLASDLICAHAGKMSEHESTREKEMKLDAKLNEKQAASLADSTKLDEDLGVATPGSLQMDNQSKVKDEFPSLEVLKELSKTCQNP